MESTKLAELAKGLMAQRALSADDAHERATHAFDAGFWSGLAPALTISRDASPTSCAGTHFAPDALAAKFEQRGYFEAKDAVAPSAMAALLAAVEELRAADWPAVFMYVYDQAWLVTRVPAVHHFLQSQLGDGYRQAALLWTHYLATTRGLTGWTPHCDGHERDVRRMSLWLPVSEATIENGCMYVVPRDFAKPGLAARTSTSQLEPAELMDLLRHARSLPASPGTVLGWGYDVMHWGSAVSGDGTPRVSMAVEMLGEGTEPKKSEQPLVDPAAPLPTLEERLEMICGSIRVYAGREPLVGTRYMPVVAAIEKRLGIQPKR